MTQEEFLALEDDDDIDWELIRGELRERSTTTRRGYARGVVLPHIGRCLNDWSNHQPAPQGFVLMCKPLVRLRPEPLTFVGMDLVYFEARSMPADPRRARFVDGPPVLAVEILSPSDEQEEVADRVREYLDAGVPLVWIVDTFFSTVTVHRPDKRPQLFNVDQEITAEPFLPGFVAPVAEFFEDIES